MSVEAQKTNSQLPLVFEQGTDFEIGSNYLSETNEEKFCFCQGVSYGDMVECESQSCKFKWFHFSCVGLEAEPEGKWYCSDICKDKAKKKKRA